MRSLDTDAGSVLCRTDTVDEAVAHTIHKNTVTAVVVDVHVDDLDPVRLRRVVLGAHADRPIARAFDFKSFPTDVAGRMMYGRRMTACVDDRGLTGIPLKRNQGAGRAAA